jgi:hypothetical protein
MPAFLPRRVRRHHQQGKSTMTDQKNGQAPANMPTADQVTAADQALARIKPLIQPSVHVLVRGLLMSCPGIPPHVVLCSIAFEAGNFMGQVFQGDLATIASLRNSIKAAFDEGMKKAPLIQPQSNWTPPGDQPKG